MKVCRIAALLFFTVSVVASRADDTNVTLTVDGVTYSNVTFRTVTPLTVTVFHKTGIVTIPLEKLPPDLQQHFGYDPKKAAADKREHERQLAEQTAFQKETRDKILLDGKLCSREGRTLTAVDGWVFAKGKFKKTCSDFLDSPVEGTLIELAVERKTHYPGTLETDRLTRMGGFTGPPVPNLGWTKTTIERSGEYIFAAKWVSAANVGDKISTAGYPVNPLGGCTTILVPEYITFDYWKAHRSAFK